MVEPDRRNLGERYELAQLIAAGGMGQVWRGTDVLLGRPVAVKVLRSEYTGDPTFLARFRAEAQHAAALSHPHIATVFDYGEVQAADGSGETLAYLVMELVEGEPLSAVLHREGRLDAAATLSLLEQTASALAEAHRVGLVHRDVKPGNILVRPDGSVKITDFGIAWSAGSVPLTRTGQVIGTPQYLAPEVAEGHHATPASDVYALGLVGYECLTGHPAFAGDNAVTIALKQLREDPEPLPADLPGGVRALIRRALAKDPAARMPDGAAFVAAVADVRAGRLPEEPAPTRGMPLPAPAAPAAARGVPAPRALPPVAPSRRAVSVLVPLLALLLGAGVAAGVFAAVSDDGGLPTVAAVDSSTEGDEGVVLEGVVLDAADYVGRPVDEVALQLSSLGLTVLRQQEVTADAAPGAVTGVDPTGVRLAPGDDVRVAFAVAPQEPDRPRREAPPITGASTGADVTPAERIAPVTEAAVPPPAPPTPTTAAPTSTTAASPSAGGATASSSSPTAPPTAAPTSRSPAPEPDDDEEPDEAPEEKPDEKTPAAPPTTAPDGDEEPSD